jgi:hypothetical protein
LPFITGGVLSDHKITNTAARLTASWSPKNMLAIDTLLAVTASLLSLFAGKKALPKHDLLSPGATAARFHLATILRSTRLQYLQ